MKHQSILSTILLAALMCIGSQQLTAQTNQLDSLIGYNFKVYYSKGHQARAQQMAKLSHDAIVYANELLQFKPNVTLKILSPADWPVHTTFPVYGMPHYTDNKTLIVAAEDNAFWKSFIPPMDQLPPTLAAAVKTAYSLDGQLSMQPFFDLLALHELGHAYHNQASRHMQRKWMGELFCNIFLHTYITEKEPQRLPALTVFPDMVVAGSKEGYSFTTLDQFEKNYDELGTRHPKNYGWYQCRLHAAARVIYDAGGKTVLQKLWKALQSSTSKDDKQLAEQLAKEVHPAMADVMLKW